MAAFDAGTSAAKRRRERRLPSWWRHERMSIAAVLAAVSHHSYPQVDMKNDVLRGWKTVTTTRVGPAEYYDLSSDDGRPTGGGRPAALLEPLPREKVQRHAGSGHEIVQNLDVPVLQMVEQLPNVIQFFAAHLPVAEPVIEVPKILSERVPQRFVERCPPKKAEQLVEVPTIVSHSSLQGILEHIADIPLGRVVGDVFKIYSLDRIQQRFGEAEHVAIPVPTVVCMFSLILVVHALPEYRVKVKVFFFFFGFSLGPKKSEVRRECGAAPGGQVMDAGGL